MKALIFYCKAGGGHQKAAELIQGGLIHQGCNVEIKNGFDLEGKNGFDFAQFAYRLLIRQLFWLWIIIVKFQRSFFGFFLLLICYEIGKFFLYKKFEKLILDYRPNKVISTYYFFAKLAGKISDKHSLNLEITTIVTDPFSPEKIWFTDKKGKYLVYSKSAQQLSLKYGLNINQTSLINPIIETKLINREKLKSLNQNFNFNPKKKTVLILGGGDGMQKGAKILSDIINSNLDLNIIVVCGRNEKFYKSCHQILDHFNSGYNVKIFKFVNFVNELISIADIVVSKAGPGVIFEVLKANKPLILSEFIWPQEKGLVSFITGNKLGSFKPKTNELVLEIESILNKQTIYQKFDNQKIGLDLNIGLKEAIKILV